ncbi:protein AIM2 [Cladorrhinum sp. PSN332]|nr:protein AIM2 [Cladorrhinum sp. PSN332]
MRITSLLSSTLLLLAGASGSVSATTSGNKNHGNNKDGTTSPQFGASSLLVNTGQPVGKEFVHKNITFYISKPDPVSPRTRARAGDAVLFLTDVFGLALPQNKLLIDSFARAGYLTLGPDLFQGAPAPADINVPGFNTSAFLAAHSPSVTDPIVATAIEYLRDTLKVSRIGVTGYCFGGRYAFRFAAPGKGTNAAFTAHPSLVEDQEILGIGEPLAVAAADNDSLLNATARASMEALLGRTGQRYQVNLYGGTPHGFAVRANLSVPSEKYGKEESFVQAVRWFDTFLV